MSALSSFSQQLVRNTWRLSYFSGMLWLSYVTDNPDLCVAILSIRCKLRFLITSFRLDLISHHKWCLSCIDQRRLDQSIELSVMSSSTSCLFGLSFRPCSLLDLTSEFLQNPQKCFLQLFLQRSYLFGPHNDWSCHGAKQVPYVQVHAIEWTLKRPFVQIRNGDGSVQWIRKYCWNHCSSCEGHPSLRQACSVLISSACHLDLLLISYFSHLTKMATNTEKAMLFNPSLNHSCFALLSY